MTKASDALPKQLQTKYLQLMKDKNVFWFDMMKLCLDFGLRNEESRNLKVIEINQSKQTITLSSSKQVKAYITKTANKAVAELWITQAQMYLYDVAISRGDQLRAMSADLLDSESALAKLAIKLQCSDEYQKAKETHYNDTITEQRAIASKTAPKGREIDYSGYKQAINIINKRMNQCEQTGSEYLFPCNELAGNRAKAKGFEPVTRQAVYSVIESIKARLKESKLGKFMNGIRIGLHTMRKTAVQKVATAIDLQAASLWIGHGSIAVTEAYTNKSAQRMAEIKDKLSSLHLSNDSNNEFEVA